jgi:hypothetical protein
MIETASYPALTNRIHSTTVTTMPITEPTTIYYTAFPSSPDQQQHSPNSVIPIEPLQRGTTNDGKTALDAFQLEHRPLKMQRRDDGAWVCPVSFKASRNTTSVKEMVQPIVEQMQMGYQRPDGKNPISLAVSRFMM